MQLWQQILISVLSQEEAKITFPDISTDVAKIVEGKCYQSLKKIKEILEDHTLEDEECFKQIEGVVCVLEELGSNAGDRHDFPWYARFSRIIAKSNISYKIKI